MTKQFNRVTVCSGKSLKEGTEWQTIDFKIDFKIKKLMAPTSIFNNSKIILYLHF